MSDEQDTETQDHTKDETAAAAPPPPPEPVMPAPGSTGAVRPTGDPAWLPERLERERRKLLKDLGVEDINQAKAALAAHKKRADADKSEMQRMQERLQKLEPLADAHVSMLETMKGYAEHELGRLTDTQRAAVVAVAGDDPRKQLDAVRALAPTWQSSAPPLPPATTATPAPKTSEVPPKTSALATWEALKRKNPWSASQYFLANLGAIRAEQSAAEK